MLRFTDDDRELRTQLQEALDTMLSVLRYLNASMHQVHIIGFNVSNSTDHMWLSYRQTETP